MQLKHLIAGSMVLGLCLSATAQAQSPKTRKLDRGQTDKATVKRVHEHAAVQQPARQAQGGSCFLGVNGADDCGDAETTFIFDGFTDFSNTAATTDGPTWDTASCPEECGAGEQANQDLWWTYTASCTGTLTITTCNELGGDASFDTLLALYEVGDQDCPGALLNCNDDVCDDIYGTTCGGGPFHSIINQDVTAGDTYIVRVGAWSDGEVGTGTLKVTCDGTTSCGDGVCNFPGEVCSCSGAGQDCEAFLCDESQAEGNCFDGIDNDCDTLADCDDADCQVGNEIAGLGGNCNDDVDNDCDGVADCDDTDCAGDIICNPSTADCPEHNDTLLCQAPNQMSNNGVSGATSDLNPELGFTVADNIPKPLGADNTITSFCVYGSYILFANPNSPDCGPGNVPDNFRLTIYNDNNGGLIPGTVKAGPYDMNNGLTWAKTYTGNTITNDAGNMREQFIFTFTLPEVLMQGEDECLWLEVANDTTGSVGDCGWLWDTTAQGDGLSAQDTDAIDAPGYAPGDSNQVDHAFCVGGDQFVNTVDVCGALTMGACCTPVTAVCIDDVPFNECLGQFTADTLCADLDPECGFIETVCNLDTQATDNPACQPTDLNTGLIVNGQAFLTSKKMDIAEELEVSEVCWWGSYYDFGAGETCAEEDILWENYTITFFADDNGDGEIPGTLLNEYNVGAAPRIDTGTANFAGTEYSFSAQLPETLVIPAGTFWVAVQNDGTVTEEFSCADAAECETLGCPMGTTCDGGFCTDCFPSNTCTFTWVTEGTSTASTNIYAQTDALPYVADDTADGSPAICLGAAAPCTTVADCGDTDNDGFRDDVCLHYACEAGVCVESARGVGQSDMGGSFGACANDGTCDGNDRFLALNCFGGTWAGDPCEVSPPSAINVDAGGSFGSCVLDGVCDGNDAFAALNCFAGDMACPCGGAPSPEFAPTIDVVDSTPARLVASNTRVKPGDLVSVDVYFDEPLTDLRGYQLHIVPVGGDRGQLELVDIAVENRRDAAMPAEWQAFNIERQQMVVGRDAAGVETQKSAYLATFTYRVSRDAAGTFVVDMLHDNSDPTQRTFVFPTPNHAKIQITGTTPARIVVDPVRRVSR